MGKKIMRILNNLEGSLKNIKESVLDYNYKGDFVCLLCS